MSRQLKKVSTPLYVLYAYLAICVTCLPLHTHQNVSLHTSAGPRDSCWCPGGGTAPRRTLTGARCPSCSSRAPSSGSRGIGSGGRGPDRWGGRGRGSSCWGRGRSRTGWSWGPGRNMVLACAKAKPNENFAPGNLRILRVFFKFHGAFKML